MKNSLYTLTNEFLEIVSQLEEYDLDDETFQDTLDSLQAPIEEKVENIVKYMKSLESLAEAKKAEAKRLSESAASDLKKVEWFKNYLANNLKKANIKELQAGVFKIGFQKGTEVVQVDESKLPDYPDAPYLYKHKIEVLGKTDLKKLLKEGKEITGVSLVRNPDSLVVK